jgi:hypothetical protein
VSAGKPLWVTECNIPVKWTGDEKLKEPSPGDLRVQAERVARVFATALHEGGAPVFYFLFPHYVEGQTQFGIVRPDLTPRPAYVALAAVGRFLADAKPLGRLPAPPNVRAYLVHARPDGQDREVLVAWATDGRALLSAPSPPVVVCDLLGRNQVVAGEVLELGAAPLFAVFRPGTFRRLALDRPSRPLPRLTAKPSPVVFQALFPKDRVALKESAYRIDPNQPFRVPIRVYNFGNSQVRGKTRIAGPPEWKLSFPSELDLQANTDATLALVIDCQGKLAAETASRVLIEADFGVSGRSVLSLRFTR